MNDLGIEDESRTGVARPEDQKFAPDQELKREEIIEQGHYFIAEFADLFRDDPDAKTAIAEHFFGFDTLYYDRDENLPPNAAFSKDKAIYGINMQFERRSVTEQSENFRLERVEGDQTEILTITVGDLNYPKTQLIKHELKSKNGTLDTVVNKGLAVTASREMLERVRNDFHQ